MEKEFNELFKNLIPNIKSETQIFEFYTRRIISEVRKLFTDFDISIQNEELISIVQKFIYNSGKSKQNLYINNINTLNYDLILFVRSVSKVGTTPLLCNKKANNYIDKTNELNTNVNYEKEFSNLRENVLKCIGYDNQQLDYQLKKFLNDDRISLQTSILKIRDENKKIFHDIKNKIEKLYLFKYNNSMDKEEQIGYIENYLTDINDERDLNNRTKVLQILEDYSVQISKDLDVNKQKINNKNQIITEILTIFRTEFNKGYIDFKNKLNNEFVPMLKSRVEINLPINPKFEISRDKVTYQEVKKFASENHLIDLDIAFVKIEQLLINKYELRSSNSNYSKILNILNIKKSEMDNLLQRIENKILIQNVVEMQSKINEMTSNRMVIVKTEISDK